jgi:hypothetical protein
LSIVHNLLRTNYFSSVIDSRGLTKAVNTRVRTIWVRDNYLTMTDAVGLTASVIAIAALAYQSTKTLYELIDGIVNAPKQLKALSEDLDIVNQLLASIKAAMEGTSDGKLSEGVKKCLEDVKPSMQGCKKACDEFVEKLSKITRHSSSDHTRFDDRLKLQFQEKEILAFKYRIGSYKSTLSIALGLATL